MRRGETRRLAHQITSLTRDLTTNTGHLTTIVNQTCPALLDLHVLTRWRSCPQTKTYITRRRAEGRTDREIRRSLKRYTARQLYRTLNTHHIAA